MNFEARFVINISTTVSQAYLVLSNFLPSYIYGRLNCLEGKEMAEIEKKKRKKKKEKKTRIEKGWPSYKY